MYKNYFLFYLLLINQPRNKFLNGWFNYAFPNLIPRSEIDLNYGKYSWIFNLEIYFLVDNQKKVDDEIFLLCSWLYHCAWLYLERACIISKNFALCSLVLIIFETFITILKIQNSHFLININNFTRKWAQIS